MFLTLICIPLISSEAEHFSYFYIVLMYFGENAALKICASLWFSMHRLAFHFSFHEISQLFRNEAVIINIVIKTYLWCMTSQSSFVFVTP